MKNIAFIGGFDKTDFIISVAKILVECRKKVLVIDATLTGKARYVVPSVSPSQFYVSSYQGVDVAVGFVSLEDLTRIFRGI